MLPSSVIQPQVKPTVYPILFAVSLVHLLNDSMQAVIPAIFPILKESMNLSYLQLGFIGFAMNLTASLLQPAVGLYSDRNPTPYALPFSMMLTFFGMLGLAFAANYAFVLLSVIFIGLGSAVFHPEAARVAHMAAGPRRGLAQSIFQVGGNAGLALAPIMTILIFVRLGQAGAIWFTAFAAAAIAVQLYISSWYKGYLLVNPRQPRRKSSLIDEGDLSRHKQIVFAIVLLIFLTFARSWFNAGITNYYPFYLMEKYGIALEQAQIYIFLFLLAGALGTFFGGPLADRFGKRAIIWFSMLGSAPLALMLPYANLFWSYVICFVNGFIILSSFSVSVVYAQELVPGKVGTVAGLITGFAFGMGAVGSVAMGGLADWFSLNFVMIFCSFLPLLGILTFFLPSDRKIHEWAKG